MCETEVKYIFFSRANYRMGEKLRDSLWRMGKILSYCSAVEELMMRLVDCPNTVVFWDSSYKKYARLASVLLESGMESLKFCKLVFVDGDADFYDKYLNGKNAFFVSTHDLDGGVCMLITKCEVQNKKLVAEEEKDLGKVISEYLTLLGFSRKLIGFKYLKQCIEKAVLNNFTLGSLSGEVYPYVALLNNTARINIERSIRTSIRIAYGTTGFEVKGFEALANRKCSNRYFISSLVDKLMNELNYIAS